MFYGWCCKKNVNFYNCVKSAVGASGVNSSVLNNSSSVVSNPDTGNVLTIFIVIIGLLSLGYSIMYYKRVTNN